MRALHPIELRLVPQKGFIVQLPQKIAQSTALHRPGTEEQRGAIGIALLVWLFGGGLGLAILVFVLLKVF